MPLPQYIALNHWLRPVRAHSYESLDLLASEEAAGRERVRLEKLRKKEDQAALKSRDRLRRKERWAQLLGSGKQRWVFFVFGALIA